MKKILILLFLFCCSNHRIMAQIMVGEPHHFLCSVVEGRDVSHDTMKNKQYVVDASNLRQRTTDNRLKYSCLRRIRIWFKNVTSFFNKNLQTIFVIRLYGGWRQRRITRHKKYKQYVVDASNLRQRTTDNRQRSEIFVNETHQNMVQKYYVFLTRIIKPYS